VESTELAVLEALADPRIAGSERSLSVDELEAEVASILPGASWQSVEEQGLVEQWGDRVQLVVDGGSTLDELRAGREVEWPPRSVRLGELLDAFAERCREAPGVEVLEQEPSRLVLRRGQERARLELRAGFLFCDRLAGDEPLLLIGELTEGIVERFLAPGEVRSSFAAYDPLRLQKVVVADSDVFSEFESFLRETYGVEFVQADSLQP
jgi:hypothetical protein